MLLPTSAEEEEEEEKTHARVSQKAFRISEIQEAAAELERGPMLDRDVFVRLVASDEGNPRGKKESKSTF